QLWEPRSGRVVVSASAVPPAGFTTAEAYLAVPSLGDARHLVPLRRRPAAAVLRSYGRLRSRRLRTTRLMLAAALAAGAGRLLGQPLYVHLATGLPRTATPPL